MVGAALLDTLAKGLGDEFTPEVRDAWATAYGVLSGAMIEGRPAIPKDVQELIRKMSRENPLWGAPRIHGELLKLGIDIGETA